MTKKITILILITIATWNAKAMKCEPPDGDSPDQYEIRLETFNNGLWDYVSSDPTKWIISVNPKNKKTKYSISRVVAIQGYGSIEYSADFTKELKEVSPNRFELRGPEQAEFKNKWLAAFKKFILQDPAAVPQMQTLNFSFDTEPAGLPALDCTIGIGTNELNLTLLSEDGKGKITNYAVKVEVNNPEMGKSVTGKTNENGVLNVKGLPIGTFIVALPTPNKAAPIAHIYDVNKRCDLVVQRDRSAQGKADESWTVKTNTCANLDRAR